MLLQKSLKASVSFAATLALAGTTTGVTLVSLAPTASAEPMAPCYVRANGMMVRALDTTTLSSCGVFIRAGNPGAQWNDGRWGNYPVQVNSANQIYINGKYVGDARAQSNGNRGQTNSDGLYRQNAEYYNRHQLPIRGGSYTGAQ